jgi:hypothetical protein
LDSSSLCFHVAIDFASGASADPVRSVEQKNYNTINAERRIAAGAQRGDPAAVSLPDERACPSYRLPHGIGLTPPPIFYFAGIGSAWARLRGTVAVIVRVRYCACAHSTIYLSY